MTRARSNFIFVWCSKSLQEQTPTSSLISLQGINAGSWVQPRNINVTFTMEDFNITMTKEGKQVKRNGIAWDGKCLSAFFTRMGLSIESSYKSNAHY